MIYKFKALRKHGQHNCEDYSIFFSDTLFSELFDTELSFKGQAYRPVPTVPLTPDDRPIDKSLIRRSVALASIAQVR